MAQPQLTYSRRNPCHQPIGLNVIAMVLFTVIALLPVFLMLCKSVLVDGAFTIQKYKELISDTRLVPIFIRSVAMAAGAAFLSMLFGFPLAVYLAKTRFVGHGIAKIAYLLPLFIPPHVHAIAWLYMLGEKGTLQQTLMGVMNSEQALVDLYSPLGATVILFLAYYPIFVLILATGLSQIDRRMEEAAGVYRTPLAVFRNITLPLIRPYLFSGLVFVFIFSFFNYGIPSMLRVTSYPVEIFARFSAFYDEAGATALSVPLVIIALMLLLLNKRFMKDLSYVTIKGASRTELSLKKSFSWSASLFVWLFLLISIVTPFIALLLQAGAMKSFVAALKTSHAELLSSILISAVSATLCCILAYFLSVYMEETKGWTKEAIKGLSLLPFAFPSTLFGIGLIYLWNNSATQLVYSSSSILVVAYIACFVPLAIFIITSGLKQISPSLKEAAILCRRSRWERLILIELPPARQVLTVSWVVIFIFSMGELGATLLVIPPGEGTLSLKIYTLMHYGSGPLVAALALLLILVNLVFSSAIFWCTRKL